jgi:hypothetical protein
VEAVASGVCSRAQLRDGGVSATIYLRNPGNIDLRCPFGRTSQVADRIQVKTRHILEKSSATGNSFGVRANPHAGLNGLASPPAN